MPSRSHRTESCGIHEGINLKLEMLKMREQPMSPREVKRTVRKAADRANVMMGKHYRPPMIRASFALPGELIVDSFAGGGGASTGLEMALNRPVDIAINHNPTAIAMHESNHPHTRHFTSNIWEVDPLEATKGKPVGLAWFSPDCKDHSVAKGGMPRDKNIRGLAWVVIHWAKTVRPRIILLENVCEWEEWGPVKDGKRDPKRKGQTFKRWVRKLASLGYHIEWRRLVAAHDPQAPVSGGSL
jgi:C-5 cytosine-specific DNA methylase